MKENKCFSRLVYRGRILDLYKDNVVLEDGREAEREVVRHRDAVCVLALRDDNNIIMIRQYRYPVGKEIMEIPAGIMEEGETPIGAAFRELKEETGYTAGEMEKVFSFYSSPGFTDEKLHLFVARNLTAGSQNPDPDEQIDIVEIGGGEAYDRVLKGEIEDSKTIIAILYYNKLFGN